MEPLQLGAAQLPGRGEKKILAVKILGCAYAPGGRATFLTHFLDISSNPTLLRIEIPMLTNISNSCSIRENIYLEDIQLMSLSTIGLDLNITANTSLNDLDDLYAITSIGRNLNISNNTQLSTSEVDALISNIGTSNIVGAIVNTGNAP